MTFAEILSLEENNWDTVYLYREGLFFKAYQHSACLVHLHIHDFKLSKRYIKSVNENVYSLGFPQSSALKWLNGFPHHYVNDTLLKCEIGKFLSETEYESWKECVLVNAGDRYTPHTHIIEKAPVYKNAYDLLTQVFDFSVNVSRNVQNPLCDRLKLLCYELCFSVRNLFDCVDRNYVIDQSKEKCKEIEYILQILKDLKEISLKSYALASERIVSVSKQLTALRVEGQGSGPGAF